MNDSITCRKGAYKKTYVIEVIVNWVHKELGVFMKVKKEKKKLKWWQVVLRIILVLLIIFCVFIGFSVFTILKFTGDSLSLRGTMAMVGYGGIEMPIWYQKFVLGNDHEYENLPEIFVNNEGKEVTDKRGYAARREEMLDLYEEYMYGETPSEGYDMDTEILEEGEALDGKAHRQQVKITITTDKGSKDFIMLVYTPTNKEKYGMFVGENFGGNTSILNDEKILPSNVQDKDNLTYGGDPCPVEQIIDSGYGVATTDYLDWAEDTPADFQKNLLEIFPESNATAFSAWSFGYMRMIDYLCDQPQVDEDKIATFGHSRLARVSLWTAAQDDRVDLAISSCGGGMIRSDVSGRIVRDGTSDHWFTSKYFEYTDRDSEIPVDSNMLFAMIADRCVFVSMGNVDLASDPSSTVDALQNAKAVWKNIYGKEVLDDFHYFDLELNKARVSESQGIYLHQGGHKMMNEDWEQYISYMDKYVK